MGRPRQRGVTLHKGSGQYYFRDAKGKRIYCGTDKPAAWAKWHRYELKTAIESGAALQPEIAAAVYWRFGETYSAPKGLTAYPKGIERDNWGLDGGAEPSTMGWKWRFSPLWA